ncbi:MAG: hypothetical protein RML94_04005 [Bacteroidia bacterium]|nr:hypothetical protein [Bacteroidia bacterium]
MSAAKHPQGHAQKIKTCPLSVACLVKSKSGNWVKIGANNFALNSRICLT